MEIKASRQEERDDEISLVKLFQCLIRKARWIALVTVLGLLAGGGISYFLIQPVYSATTTLYVSSDNGQEPILTESGLRLSQRLAQTYIVILQSNTILEKTAKQMQVEDIDAATLRKMMGISAINETETLSITMRHTNPEIALKALNALVANAPGEVGRVVRGGVVSIIDQPELSQTVDWPVKKNTLIGGIIGFVLSAGLVILQGLLDKTVYTAEDIVENCDFPILGEIPDAYIKDLSKGKGGIYQQ